MIFQEAAGAFITYARVDRMYALETQTKIRDCLQSWLLAIFGTLELSGLSVLEILDFRRLMVEKQLSVARQYSLLVVLKIFLKFCRTVLKCRTLDPAEIRLPRRPYRRVEFLTDQEVQRLLAIVPTHHFTGIRLRALLEVLLSTGMRISEALSLNRDALEQPDGEVNIIGKGSKSRTVFLSPRCLVWLRKLIETRTDRHPAIFVTTGRTPRRLTRNDMSKVFERLRLGIAKRLTPHLLRHTFCTGLLRRGADITFIKELAGHQDIQTTARYYLGVDNKVLRQVLERCGSLGWNDLSCRIPDSDATPPLQSGGQAPSNTGMWSPGVHAQGSP
jgi:integrase/recombinase XerD